jgi:hypothetical protein
MPVKFKENVMDKQPNVSVEHDEKLPAEMKEFGATMNAAYNDCIGGLASCSKANVHVYE